MLIKCYACKEGRKSIMGRKNFLLFASRTHASHVRMTICKAADCCEIHKTRIIGWKVFFFSSFNMFLVCLTCKTYFKLFRNSRASGGGWEKTFKYFTLIFPSRLWWEEKVFSFFWWWKFLTVWIFSRESFSSL